MRNKPILLIIFLVISTTNFNVSAWSDINTNFAFDGNGTLIYTVDALTYGADNYWNITVWDEMTQQDRQIGAITAGDLLFMQFSHLEDMANKATDQSIVQMKGSSMTESWEYRYDWNVSYGQYPSDNAPPFLLPVITIPQSYLADSSNMTDWNHIVDGWNAQPGWTASITGTEFTLSGPTSGNITSFASTWDINSGIMKNYSASGNDEGNNYSMTLSFLYIRNESQWDMHWGAGVQPSLMYGLDFATNLSDGIEFGDSVGAYSNNLTNGLLVFNVNELSDLQTSEPNWNGSAMTTEWKQDFHFEYHDIGMTDQGPRVWYPILPLGNDLFFGNITTDFTASGASVTNDGATFGVYYNDEYGYENATWDMTTGLMQTMRYQGSMNGTSFWASMDFVYAFNGGDSFNVNNIDARYIIDTAKNGTNNFLDFGESTYHDENGTEMTGPFILNPGDIFSVHGGWQTYWDGDHNVDEFRWNARTSAGYQVEARTNYMPPGLDVGQDGPPIFYLVIPTDNGIVFGNDWFNTLEGVYNSLGYTVTNNATDFGISGVVNEMNVHIVWNKDNGVMNYYKVDANIDGNNIIWEMHLGTQMIPLSEFSWGVSAGTTLNYVFTQLSQPLDFGSSDTAAGTTINQNDIMMVTIKKLGDLQNEGPFVVVDMQVNGVTEADAEMGMQEPGFEFAFMQDGPPPLLYFVIPVGTPTFWNWVMDMYQEVGYEVVKGDTTLSVHAVKGTTDITSVWSMQTGLLQSYEFSGNMSEGMVNFKVDITDATVVSSTTSNSTSDTSSLEGLPSNPLPVDPFFFISLPLMAIVLRRKRE